MYICIITAEIIFRDFNKQRLNDELIEFTSILLKEEENKIEYIEIYHKYVKPFEYMNIAGECWEEKGIRFDMILNEGVSFHTFIEDYTQWIHKYKNIDDKLILITIDNHILHLLQERCKKMNNGIMNEFSNYYTIREIYREIENDKLNYTLSDILFKLGLSLYMRYSGCIDDCRSIARVIEKLYIDGYSNKINKLFNINRNKT
jgi:inhibitor of KinA sporulation pathway (predicted exonuclease)